MTPVCVYKGRSLETFDIPKEVRLLPIQDGCPVYEAAVI